MLAPADGRPINLRMLFDAILFEPDGLEPGLRLLETDHPTDGEAHVARGFDRRGTPLALYLTRDPVGELDLDEVLASLMREVDPAGRVLVLAGGFSENLVTDPPTRHAGWSVELLLWRGSTDPLTGEILVEISEPEYYREPELPGGDAGPLLPSLTAQEVESLVGSWPSAPGRSRP